MSEASDIGANGGGEPRCDCGYVCCGATLDERVRDGQRHAQEVHGIDVSPDQVLTSDRTSETAPEAAAQPVMDSGRIRPESMTGSGANDKDLA